MRALMSRGRRYLAAAILAILAAPAAGMLAAPYETGSVAEHRVLARAPSSRTPEDWRLWPRGFDAWFADHFAWRGALVKTSLAAQARLGLRPSNTVMVVNGKGDWLLLDEGLLGAVGGKTDRAAAGRYGAFVCDLAGTVTARGARFLFAPAPAAAEVYPEALPDWISPRSPTQPELVLQAARACGVEPLDLRPAMIAARTRERLYQHHDSHWTNAGALIAYNSVARVLAQPWAIDSADLHWRPGKPLDSDLVRMSGRFDLPQELAPEPPEGPDVAPQAGRLTDLAHGAFPAPFVIPGRKPGPTVLIVGDSYAADFMGQYFRRAQVTMAWIHHGQCRFDRRILDRVKPDFVVLMPASRLEACR